MKMSKRYFFDILDTKIYEYKYRINNKNIQQNHTKVILPSSDYNMSPKLSYDLIHFSKSS